jgi:hypothetical protein
MAMPKVNLPTKDALLNAMILAKNSKEAADYLVTRFDALLVKAKIGDAANELKEQIHLFAQNVGYQLAGNKDSWRGKEAMDSLFEVMHENIANEATSFFNKINEQQAEKIGVRLDFAINEQGRFLRGYSKPEVEKAEVVNQQPEGGHHVGGTA